MKRTVSAPSNGRPLQTGELLSAELGSDEDVQWIWSHHGERGSSVIGYTTMSREPIDVPRARSIGFFPLEETPANELAEELTKVKGPVESHDTVLVDVLDSTSELKKSRET